MQTSQPHHLVLAYSQRINLDGTPSAEDVNDESRRKAKEQLDRIAARKAKKAIKMQDKRRVGLAADLSREWVEAVRNAQVSAQDAP